MRLLRLVAVLSFLAFPAVAGENIHLGTATMTGASITNLTTAVPFKIPPGAYLTVRCSADVQMLADSLTVSASTLGTKGLTVPASTNFPTSSGRALAQLSTGPTAVFALIGTAAVTCDFWQRTGTE